MPGRIDLSPPVKGIDQSLPARAQADLTCPDARNVRSQDIDGNATVAKRDGYKLAFDNAAGGGSGAPITGLTTAQRASSTAPSVVGREVPVVERWAGYAIDTPYSGYMIGTDLKAEYVRFSRKITDYGANGWQGSSVPPNTSIVLVRSGSSFVVNCVEALSTFADGYGLGFASAFGTTNDMTVQFNGYRRARAVDFLDCHNCGPFARGHPNLGFFVWAYLERTAENTVRLRIMSMEANSEVEIASGDPFTLSGSAILSDNLRIRLITTTSGVEARLTWPDELGTEEKKVSAASSRGATTALVSFNTLSGTPAAGHVVTQAVSGASGVVMEATTTGTDGYLILWVTSSAAFNGTNNLSGNSGAWTATATGAAASDNTCAGWFFKDPGTSYPGSEPGYFRRISGMDFSKLVPPEPEVVAEILGTDFYAGAARYIMKPNWMGIDIDSSQGAGNTLYHAIGGLTGLSSATALRAPMIDSTLDVLYGPNVLREARSGILTIELWATTPPDEFLRGEIIRHRDIAEGEEDTGGFVFYMENL